MPYDHETLAITLDRGVLDVVLHRPEVRNAVSHQMQAEIDLMLDEAELDEQVRAVVLRGAGKVFTAGHDLKANAEKSFAAAAFPFASPSVHPKLPRAWYFRKPLIGAVHGFVGPYGLALVGCCDFNIAAVGTRFSCELFRLSGTVPHVDWLPLYLQLPMRVIEKLFLLGGWMDAEQALQFQLVQRVVPEAEVVAVAHKWAEQAALIPTETFGHSKDQIRRSIELMGLAQLPSALARYGPAPTTNAMAQFDKIAKEQGLRAALDARDAQFDAEISRV